MALLGLLQACNSDDALAPVPEDTTGGRSPAIVQATPIVSGFAPDTAVAGQTLSVVGNDLPSALHAIRVTLGGVALEVRGADGTRIDAGVPAGAFPCAPLQSHRLEVAVDGVTLFAQDVPVRTARRVALTPGQSAMPSAGTGAGAGEGREESSCIELVGAGDHVPGAAYPVRARFVVALVNGGTDLSQPATFALRGIGSVGYGEGADEARVPVMTAIGGANGLGSGYRVQGLEVTNRVRGPASRDTRPETRLVTPKPQTHDSEHVEHPAHLLSAQSLLAGPAGAVRSAWARRGSARAALRAERRVGDTVTMSALLNSCIGAQPVRARVVYVGTRALVLEDVTAPRAGRMDASYRAIGAEFDTLVYPLLTRNIGDPLAMDATMQGDGRITMLFTSFVNDSVPGTAGYVSACNFHPRSTFAASNEDEVFYARVATLAETPDEWRRVMRATVVHEAKHLASFAERLVRGVAFEETWLEEATARIAEELYARSFPGGGTWRGNTGFAGSLGCELLQCDDRPLVMWRHFSQLYHYLRGTDGLSPLGPTSRNDVSWYASGWSLVRFVLDRHVPEESASLRRLVRGDAGRGLAALESLAGMRSEAMLAGWALTNAGHGVSPASGSWDLASMWGGLAELYTGIYDGAPLRGMQYPLGSAFRSEQQVVAGGVAYLVLQGDGGVTSQILDLSGETDASAHGESGRLAWSVVRVY